MSPLSSYNDAGGKSERLSSVRNAHAGYDAIGDDRALRRDAGFELRPRGDGRLQQEVIEVTPCNGGASQTIWIVRAHLRAAGTGDGHAGDRQRPLFDKAS
jgi:hypothetical protein